MPNTLTFPTWLRSVVTLSIVLLALAYMAAPLLGIIVEMPRTLEFISAPLVAAIVGLDFLKKGRDGA